MLNYTVPALFQVHTKFYKLHRNGEPNFDDLYVIVIINIVLDSVKEIVYSKRKYNRYKPQEVKYEFQYFL